MNIFGKTTVGSAPVSLAIDVKLVSRFLVPLDCYLVKLSAYMDGAGAGVGSQVVKGVAYGATSNALLATSKEVTIADGQAPGWVDFVFDPPVALTAGYIDLGTIAGGISDTARVYTTNPDDAGGRYNADTYSNGPATPFGAATAVPYRASIFATFVRGWSAPDAVDDAYIGRLPFSESQLVFSMGGASAPRFRVNCGWHDTILDDETGAFALIKTGSALEVLIGERVKISRTDKFKAGHVFCFVHNRYPLIDDISVSRRLFAELGALSADYVSSMVEVMT